MPTLRAERVGHYADVCDPDWNRGQLYQLNGSGGDRAASRGPGWRVDRPLAPAGHHRGAHVLWRYGSSRLLLPQRKFLCCSGPFEFCCARARARVCVCVAQQMYCSVCAFVCRQRVVVVLAMLIAAAPPLALNVTRTDVGSGSWTR